MIDPSNLIRFLAEHRLDYKGLAHLMKWSPSYIYGYLGGAWDVSPQFKQVFGQTFGSEIAEQIFPNTRSTNPHEHAETDSRAF